MSLGALGSLLVAYRIAARDYPTRVRATFVPWAALCLILLLAAMWLMNQPMEMRGTFLGS